MFTQIALVMVVLSASIGAASLQYEIIDLGTLGGLYSQASAINDGGQIVGVAQTAEGQDHAVSWQGGTINDLGALTPDQTSHALDINNDGQVCWVHWVCAEYLVRNPVD